MNLPGLALGQQAPGAKGPIPKQESRWHLGPGVFCCAEQFAWLKKAIANQRQVWDLLLEMPQQTVAHLWKNLPSASRRTRLSKKTSGLN